MKSKFSLLLFLCLSLFIISCEEEEPIVETIDDIVELAQDNEQFTSLVAALEKANLATTLKGSGPFTVFAPTNDAFADFLAANNFATLEDVPTAALTDVLLNHVVSGNVKSTDLSQGYVSTLSTAAPG
ncbi:MAG: fasciclin domain-containing protein, partial [Bacteroidota bacterium]